MIRIDVESEAAIREMHRRAVAEAGFRITRVRRKSDDPEFLKKLNDAYEHFNGLLGRPLVGKRTLQIGHFTIALSPKRYW